MLNSSVRHCLRQSWTPDFLKPSLMGIIQYQSASKEAKKPFKELLFTVSFITYSYILPIPNK